MTADVYTGDNDFNGPRPLDPSLQRTTFTILADPDPDVLLRVASHLNVLNQAPIRAVLERIANNEIRIQVTVDACSEVSAEMLRRKLAQLTCVIEVQLERLPTA